MGTYTTYHTFRLLYNTPTYTTPGARIASFLTSGCTDIVTSKEPLSSPTKE